MLRNALRFIPVTCAQLKKDMNKTSKLILSISPLLLMILIPYNFFVDLPIYQFDLLFNVLSVIQIFFLLGLIYILYHLWKNPKKSTSTKWTWTLLTILVFQPLTTLIYLWVIEPDKKTEEVNLD